LSVAYRSAIFILVVYDSDKVPEVTVMLDNYEDTLVSVSFGKENLFSYLDAQSILLAQRSSGALTKS
jgi:hypothetical protein